MSITSNFKDWKNRIEQLRGQGMNPAVVPEEMAPEPGSFAENAQRSQAYNMAPRADGSRPDFDTEQPQQTTPQDIPTVKLDPNDHESPTQPINIPWYDLGIMERYKPKLDTERLEGNQRAARAKLLGDAIREVVQGVYAARGGSIPAYNPQPVQDSLGRYYKLLDDHDAADYQHKLRELQLHLKNLDAEKEAGLRRQAWEREDQRRDEDIERENDRRAEDLALADQYRKEDQQYRAGRDKADDEYRKGQLEVARMNANRPSPYQLRANEPFRTIYDRNDRNKVLANLDKDQAHQLEQIILDHLTSELMDGNIEDRRLMEQLRNRAAIHPNDRWDLVLDNYDKIPQAMEFLYQLGDQVDLPDRRKPYPKWIPSSMYDKDPRIAQHFLPPTQASQTSSGNEGKIPAEDFLKAWKEDNQNWQELYPEMDDAQILQELVNQQKELLDYIY